MYIHGGRVERLGGLTSAVIPQLEVEGGTNYSRNDSNSDKTCATFAQIVCLLPYLNGARFYSWRQGAHLCNI